MGKMSVKYKVSRGSVVGSVVGQSRVSRESSRVRFRLLVFIGKGNLCSQVGIGCDYLVDGTQTRWLAMNLSKVSVIFSRGMLTTPNARITPLP